jgi:hypothetical protein
MKRLTLLVSCVSIALLAWSTSQGSRGLEMQPTKLVLSYDDTITVEIVATSNPAEIQSLLLVWGDKTIAVPVNDLNDLDEADLGSVHISGSPYHGSKNDFKYFSISVGFGAPQCGLISCPCTAIYEFTEDGYDQRRLTRKTYTNRSWIMADWGDEPKPVCFTKSYPPE